ncbi:penicillin-binding transpeptidase domain-containing protein [Clostridium sp. E02]|uniref:peptidoglycan D,D-transpeptidase FtsI family protein n=1 Tax=Clostridium sp. E02 TaxID=2487134 RepID=UPI000F53F883|nr:penicillin-binding transpeptidase domain-containing protein [Clostridium sp. E02]
MNSNKTHHREKIALLFFLLFLCMTGLMGRLVFLMVFRSEHYSAMAEDLHERERTIKAARGNIIDANGIVIATNRTVCTISVIHNQIKKADEVVAVLSKELGLEESEVRKKVQKYSSREIIKTNVDKAMGDQIRAYHMEGVKVDEDYKRYYPYDTLASKVLGFTGGDNQGIIGLEVKYESYLKGMNGKILTMSDAAGIEIPNAAEDRIEPIAGQNLTVSLDVNIQRYCEQAAYQVMEKKGANRVSIIVMNPQNGEIMAMVNTPEFNLNDPFTLNTSVEIPKTEKEKQNMLNQMWRNPCINDTYEPGSTFKIITAAAGLESGVVKLDDHFSCPGFRIVEDRRIRCHKVGGHGSETFLQGMMNSCNPVLIDVGQRLGVDGYYKYFVQFGLKGKTGIDLPGEATTIMHKKEDMGLVELATVSFGQSFQITPMQLITTASSIINGGNRITPHFGVKSVRADEELVHDFTYPVKEGILSKETSATMRYILEQVVSEGSGKRAKIEGYRIGGKTATSEKLPRSLKKYISSFIGFAPADDPKVIALITIDEPQGIYYGGTIAAPVIADIFKNILPYLGIEPTAEDTVSAFRISG